MSLARCRRQEQSHKANGVILDGQVVKNGARRRLCPVSQNVVVESRLFLHLVRDADVVGVTVRVVETDVAPPQIGWRLRPWATLLSLLPRSIYVM